MSSKPSPSASTPDPPPPSRFTSQTSTAEDLLKEQTVGLVHLSDFRKRRADALEQKEREAQEASRGYFKKTNKGNGQETPGSSDGASTPQERSDAGKDRPKKKRKKVLAGKLSFGTDQLEDEESDTTAHTSTAANSKKTSPAPSRTSTPEAGSKRLGPSPSLPTFAPKALTKRALLAEAATRESLRQEYLALQEAVKATPIAIPFVFYDGTSIPGGVCTVNKGAQTWLFLDRCRKVGAELGVGKEGGGRGWARVGVDDLMLVRGDIIVPHHYEFYYFIVNKNKGPNGQLLFDYSSKPTQNTPVEPAPLLRGPKKNGTLTPQAVESMEGAGDDPNVTKVVDRRWYEKNKHIFPASTWEDFDPEKDYANATRRDTGGNAFFF